ncbi:MAG: hypothetical protein ABR524_08500 [Thermoanaerobaculia bacterium]
MRPFIVVSSLVLILLGCSSAPQRVHAPTVIPWATAESMILEGNVRRIERVGEREIRLQLRDGRDVLAEEPTPGEATRVHGRCGEACAETELAR